VRFYRWRQPSLACFRSGPGRAHPIDAKWWWLPLAEKQETRRLLRRSVRRTYLACCTELISQACFFTQVVNQGILGHYVATASLATGSYETFDNFADVSPAHPAVFEYFRKTKRRPTHGLLRRATDSTASVRALTPGFLIRAQPWFAQAAAGAA
jgi:hypothetical protein